VASATVWVRGGRESAGLRLSMWKEIRTDVVGETIELLQGDAAIARLIASATGFTGTSDKLQPLLTELVHQHPTVHDIVLTDESGRVLIETHRDEQPSSRPMGAMSGLAYSQVRQSNTPSALSGPILIRSSETSAGAAMLGVGVPLPLQGTGGPGRVAVMTVGADMPSARSVIGQIWLIGQDGVVIAAPGRSTADAAGDVAPDWGILREMSTMSGAFTLEMSDGAHEMLYQKLEPWPAALVIDTGAVANPWLQPHGILALALGVAALLLFWRGQRFAAGRVRSAESNGKAGPGVSSHDGPMRHLAAGVAHEFNNILTVLSFDAEMLVAEPNADESVQVLSRSMLGATAMGTQLTQSLLAYAERAVLRPQMIDLELMLSQCHERLVAALDPGQSLLRAGRVASVGPVFVLVDPDALEFCLISLLRNAADVSEAGAEITLEVDITSVGGVPRVALVVDDTGPGMEADMVACAMAPGFSGRDSDRRLGLGLSAALGFARQSGGSLALESTPGLGTRARLLLPLNADEPMVATPGVSLSPIPAKSYPAPAEASRPKRVLLVEDIAPVRESIARRLRIDGFEVLEAATVAEVLAQVARGVEVMVTDIMLNDATDGWTLASRAREADPLLPLVFMSGYLSSRQPELLAGDELASFVRKPVNGMELQTVIAGLLALRETRALQNLPRDPTSTAQRGIRQRA
jgi:signal transduction histidine kinase